MPDEQPTQHPADRQNRTEGIVLYLLTGEEQPIWSADDIGRDINDPAAADDAIRNLRCAGLIHQTVDGFVFATRAGYRSAQITGPVI